MTTTTRNSYAAGHFELQIDGHKSTAYVKSVEGGWSRANIVDDPHGSDPQRVKQISNVDIDPITMEFGLAGANDMLKWIQQSWNRQYGRRNGQITHADFDLKASFEHEFFEALITETTIPALDGTSKEGGYLKCKLQPERVVTKALGSPGSRVSGPESPKQKMWVPSAFRFSIDGIDDMQYVNKLESFTVTQGVKKFYTGASRFPRVEPTNIKFPNLSGTISLKYADKLIQWHKDYIKTSDGPGTKDPSAQKSGAIEFLSPDRKQTIFRINLYEVGLAYVGVEPSKANDDSIKRLKFELYVHRMDLDGSSILGFA
jgi:hypothetical protein